MIMCAYISISLDIMYLHRGAQIDLDAGIGRSQLQGWIWVVSYMTSSSMGQLAQRAEKPAKADKSCPE